MSIVNGVFELDLTKMDDAAVAVLAVDLDFRPAWNTRSSQQPFFRSFSDGDSGQLPAGHASVVLDTDPLLHERRLLHNVIFQSVGRNRHSFFLRRWKHGDFPLVTQQPGSPFHEPVSQADRER